MVKREVSKAVKRPDPETKYVSRFTRNASSSRAVLDKSGCPMPMGRRCWVTLAVPAEVASLLQVGRYLGCRIEGVVENHSVLNWLDPLGRPLQRVRQVPPVSSRLFAERTAKMSIAQEKRTGVEERVQQGLVESVDDGSDCADHARCGLLPWPATGLARPVPVRG